MNIQEFLKKIDIVPNNMALYKKALTHSSYSNEKFLSQEDNERLEFLGDAIIGLLMADHLYQKNKEDEGIMTKKRAQAVCERSLTIYAQNINLQNYLFLGRGEKNKDFNTKSIMADAFEALFGAIYLDLGYLFAKKVFQKLVIPHLSKVIDVIDFKTQLQEIVQSDKKTIQYKIVSEQGPAHAKKFVAEVYLEKKLLGSGEGTTKKAAEQKAAQEALSKVAKI
ncbi:ribonuclease III [Candidatus Phytoplasma solani]|uniref:Ribonuclease 3 n=1 Tax=Candidatus Phytoplasma solani TaxID=69896 RepID=A0A421NYU1_9MOLU|nr:ribonuclease III [Candidatus Phytoplasma solani]RMI89185.1 ribonuclease III [Candidatus Phytoplasma solani]RMI89203.1 ribonuclease III [Candidatus Phytoplasma solani]CCP87993.1 Ribonuclease III [Candidatus Phytoplasma solani]CCP88509.1 Ribonuclease HII family protein [Candidatus Phytoplasma solani]